MDYCNVIIMKKTLYELDTVSATRCALLRITVSLPRQSGMLHMDHVSMYFMILHGITEEEN